VVLLLELFDWSAELCGVALVDELLLGAAEASGFVPVVEVLLDGAAAALPFMFSELPVELAGLVCVADVCPLAALGVDEVELLGAAAVEPD
jgi:hypothetical protein